MSINDFKNGTSLKDHLFRIILPKIYEEDRSKLRGGKKSSLCRYVKEVCKSENDILKDFKRRDTNETFNILKRTLDCNSNRVTYLPDVKIVSLSLSLFRQH